MPSMIYDIGYYGKAIVSSVPLLATGGSMSVQYSPIFTTGVWGANVSNVTQKVAYAPNYVSISANVNFQLTSGVAGVLNTVAFTNRGTGTSLQLLPNGIAGYSGTAYCISVSLSTSQDALVSGDIGFKTGSTASTILLGSASSSNTSNLNTSVPNYTDVYPYWASKVVLNKTGSTSRTTPPTTPTGTALSGITDWNASYSSDLVLAACCDNGTRTGNTLLQADYCSLGPMDATGSFTILGAQEYLQAANIQKHHGCGMSMSTVTGGSTHHVVFGQIVWTGVNMDMQSGNSLIQTSCNFSGLGNTTQAPMYFS